MQLNPHIFREYDIRGVVGKDLEPEGVKLIGRSYGTYLARHGIKRAIVGRDNRLSSNPFREAIAEGLLSAGIDVIDIGLVVTPIFYYSRIHYDTPGGVMITGSHNPPDENGFKLGALEGPGTLYGKEIQEVREIAESGNFASGKGKVEKRDPVPEYLEMIRQRIRLGPRKPKVVVDCGNGTASFFAPRLLESLGCRVVPLYSDSDPSFPNHFPDPVKPANLESLIETVGRESADLGVAYDGDADRIGAVDDKGRIVWGDYLMILFWREILPKHPGAKAIIEVKCSQALVDEVTRLGGDPIFYRTGHSLIKAKMKEIGAIFTGEMSGHLFFADEYYGYDDALYASARLLRILSHSDRSLSELLADVPRYYATPETRVSCPDDAKFEVVRAVQEAFRSRHRVIDVDGARILFPGGWGLVRASNTQPVLVLRCEGKTPEDLEKIKKAVAEEVSSHPAVGQIEW